MEMRFLKERRVRIKEETDGTSKKDKPSCQSEGNGNIPNRRITMSQSTVKHYF
jgi:hypothetical protein